MCHMERETEEISDELSSDECRDLIRESLKKVKTKDEMTDLIYSLMYDYALAESASQEWLWNHYKFLFEDTLKISID